VDRLDTTSFNDFRDNLADHVDRIKRRKRPTLILRRGKASVVVVESADFKAYADARETIDLLRAIEKGQREHAEGRTIPWNKVKKDIRARLARRIKRAHA